MSPFLTIFGLWRRLLTVALLFSVSLSATAQTGTGAAPSVQIPLLGGGSVPTTLPDQDTTSIQLWSDSVRYEPADDRFQIPYVQSDLRVGYQLNYKFTFQLKARRLNSDKLPRIPDGWYLFTTAMVLKETAHLYNGRALSLTERFVTSTMPRAIYITDGRFTESLSFRFDNLTPTALNNLLYAELLPLAKTCRNTATKTTYPCISTLPNGKADMSKSDVSQLLPGYRPYLAQLAIIPFKSKGDATLTADEDASPLGNQTLASFVVNARREQNAKRIRERPRTRTAEQYAEANNLYFLNVDDAQLKYLSPRWLRGKDPAAMITSLLNEKGFGGVTISESYKQLLPLFCHVLYQRNRQYQEVQEYAGVFGRNPMDAIRYCMYEENTLNLTRLIHIGKVDTTRPVLTSMNPQLNYTIMNNFMVTRGRTRDSSTSVSEKPLALLGPLVKFLESSGFPLPIDFTHSVSVSYSQTKAEMSMASMNEIMDFNPLGLVFGAADARVCLQVSVTPTRNMPYFDSRKGSKNGLYICLPQVERMDVEEVYAHIFTYSHDSSISKAFEPGSQTFNRSLRGDRDLSAFFYQIRSTLRPAHGPEIFPNAPASAAQSYLNRPMMEPGIIANPINFERDWQNSLTQMALFQYKEKFMEENPRFTQAGDL
ncbi:MAG: hypothetical protein KF799_01730 [Bdellovibrionales bacterium]|nr:hypothetical protein [Bdellovibrionales bacterium]